MRSTLGLVVLAVLITGSSASALNIRRIDMEGFHRVALAVVRRDFPLKAGQQYDKAEAEKAREWLLSMGLFMEVTLTAREEGQIVDLVYKVVENPDVRAVRLEGNTQLASAAIRPLLLTQPRQVLNRRSLVVDANVIGQAYVRIGMRVAIEIKFEPAPTSPDTPVVVIFALTEYKIGAVQLAPLYYLRPEKLQGYIILKPGELLMEQRLVEQADTLMTCPLLRNIGPPDVSDADAEGKAAVTFPTFESERPYLTAVTLPLVDVAKLAGVLRFQAVNVPVERPDFDLYLTPDEQRAKLAEVTGAAQQRPADGEAQYQVFAWQRRSGADATAAARRAVEVLQAGLAQTPHARLRLRLAQALDYLGQPAEAIKQAEAATKEPACRIDAYNLLLNLRLSALGREDTEAQQVLRQTVLEGADAVANLPEQSGLDEVTAAYQFYYAALTVSLLDAGLRAPLKLDGPAGRRLVAAVYELAKTKMPAAAARHLGRLMTIVGFAAKVAGPDVAGPETWSDYLELLKVAREELLTRDIQSTADQGAWFYLALNDMIRDDPAATRDTALQGLKLQPTNERLVDIFVMTCIQTRQTNPARAADLLRAAVADLQKRIADGTLPGWGGLLLLAKLELALRDVLAPGDLAGREQARQAAEAAARGATVADASLRGGWWVLGLALLKGPQPGQAVDPLTQVTAIDPHDAEAVYALAVAKLAKGDAAGGLKQMERFRPPNYKDPVLP